MKRQTVVFDTGTKIPVEAVKFISVYEFIPPVYTGSLVVRKQYPKATELPKNFKISGNLDLTGSKIRTLPRGLYVGSTLTLGKEIETLPRDMTVGEIRFNKNITFIPDGCTFTSNLFLRGTNVRTIGNNVTVEGNLNLLKSKVTSVGERLTVKGTFVFHKSKLKTLPEDLRVGAYEARGYDILHDMTVPEWLFGSAQRIVVDVDAMNDLEALDLGIQEETRRKQLR